MTKKDITQRKKQPGNIRKKITIQEVANEANVSIGTVSRVFNGLNVDPGIVKNVQAAVKKLNYKPLRNGSNSIEKKQNDFVSILVDDKVSKRSAWTQQILFSITTILGDYSYKSMLKFIPVDSVTLPDAVKDCIGCVIWGNFSEKFYHYLALVANNIPVVSYSHPIPYENSTSVLAHNEESMCIALEYLLASGHQKIGLVSHSRKSQISGERYQGFLKTMKLFKQAVNPEWLFFSDEIENKEENFAYYATSKIISQKNRPSCIVYGSDNLARVGLEAIADCGLKVPDDISILGFDDLLGSDQLTPPLTTMGLDTFAVAKMLVDSLEKLLKHRSVDKELYISRELIRRESVAVCK